MLLLILMKWDTWNFKEFIVSSPTNLTFNAHFMNKMCPLVKPNGSYYFATYITLYVSNKNDVRLNYEIEFWNGNEHPNKRLGLLVCFERDLNNLDIFTWVSFAKTFRTHFTVYVHFCIIFNISKQKLTWSIVYDRIVNSV